MQKTFLKWAGNKSKLMAKILPNIDASGNKIYHFDPERPSTLREPVRPMNKTLFYFRVLDAYRDKSGTKLHKLDLQCFQINEKAKLQIFKRNNL